MQLFFDTLSGTGGTAVAIVIGVIVLTLFYQGLSWLNGGEKPNRVVLHGVLKKETLATVHVAGREPFERVRLIGYTNGQTMSNQLPMELNGQVILEDERQTRVLIRSKDIERIVIPAETKQNTAIEA